MAGEVYKRHARGLCPPAKGVVTPLESQRHPVLPLLGVIQDASEPRVTILGRR